MNIGGLLGSAAALKSQLKKRPCKRCGLYFDPTAKPHCPHCYRLDNFELARMRERRRDEKSANKELGRWFLFFSVCVILLFIFAAFS